MNRRNLYSLDVGLFSGYSRNKHPILRALVFHIEGMVSYRVDDATVHYLAFLSPSPIGVGFVPHSASKANRAFRVSGSSVGCGFGFSASC